MHTNASVLTAHGVDLSNIEFPDLDIPVLTGAQRQGDVMLLPVTTTRAGSPLGAKGVVVVRSERDAANTHTLHTLTFAGGDCLWEPHPRADQPDQLVQGWLTVPDGSQACLCHTEEHSVLGIGAGTFEVRRQREWAGTWRRVAD